MKSPTLVLDLDGTLADTQLDLIPVLNRTIATKGLPEILMSEVGYIVGHGAKAMIERAFIRNDIELKSEELDSLFELFMTDYTQNTNTHTKVFDGVHDSLEQFKTAGWILAVCTNKQEAMAHKVLKGLKLEGFMSAVTGGDTFSVRKPDAYHLTETVKLAGGELEGTVMVGDSITDISAARNSKVPVVAVDFGYSDKPIEQYQPDIVISHYDQLFDAAGKLLH